MEGYLGPVHISPEEFENATWPTFHSDPSRKKSFLKTLLKQVEFENTAFFLR